MMSDSIIIAYGVLVFAYLYWILRLSLVPEKYGIALPLFASFWVFKCAIALVNFHYFEQRMTGSDAVAYTSETLNICKSLFYNPEIFIREFITDWGTFPDDINILSRSTRFWEQLGFNIHRRILIICNLLSFGNPYIVTLWFSVISFTGQWYIYKLFRKYYPSQSRLILSIVMLLPVAAFWSPSISKEGYMLLSFAMILYNTYRIKFESFTRLNIFGLVIGFVLLFMVRNFYIFTLLPFFLTWLFASRYDRRMPRLYITVALIGLTIFILSSFLPEDSIFNFYQNVADRQQEFLKNRNGGSFLQLDRLQPHAKNLGRVILQSLNHVFFRPFFTEAKKPDQLLYALSNTFDLIIIIASLFLTRGRRLYSSFFWFMILFSLINLTLIGMTVPAYGAISRYKMIFSLFLMLTLIVSIYPRLKKYFY